MGLLADESGDVGISLELWGVAEHLTHSFNGRPLLISALRLYFLGLPL